MTNQEYNLTIMDIEWENGNIYESHVGNKYTATDETLINIEINEDISERICQRGIATLRFKKIIDWSKVPVDTKVLVRDSEDDAWERRYFAEYADGEIYAWHGGKTSWSAEHPYSMCIWDYAKLATEEE